MGETEGPPIEELELTERPEENPKEPGVDSVYRDPAEVERLISATRPRSAQAERPLEPVDKYTQLSRERVEKYSSLTDRSFQTYYEELGIDPTTLEGKMILDVGSGEREIFSKEAAEHGATVFSINPKLKSWRTRRKLQGWFLRDPNWQGRSVAARGQDLPFRDEAFDLVTSSWAISAYSLPAGDRFRAISEMARVLKPGGSIRMYPREVGKLTTTRGTLGDDTVDWLLENGYSVNEDAEVGPIVITRQAENGDEAGVASEELVA